MLDSQRAAEKILKPKDLGFGIRIEDTYIVTKDGFERISAGAPREIDEIEKLMKEEK